jgi:hypothetical protein
MLLAALALPFAGSTAHGGVIKMQVACSVQGTNLTVRMTNTGDEPAQNVRAHVTFMDKEMHTENIGDFPPQKPKSERFALDTAGLKGTHPAVIIVDFEDLNSYPFSSVSIQQVKTKGARPAQLMGVLPGQMELANKMTVPLRVRNKSDNEIIATCRVVTPNELISNTPEFTVTVPPRGEQSASVALENFSGTPTSSYPVHVLMEYDHEEEHFSISAMTVVAIVAPSPATSKGFWLVVAVVVLIAAVLLLPQLRTKK